MFRSCLYGFSLFWAASIAVPALAQNSGLTNQDIYKMIEMKLPEAKIIQNIQCSQGTYNLSPETLKFAQFQYRITLPDAVQAAMRKANDAAIGKDATFGAACPVTRTKMLLWGSEYGASSSMGKGAIEEARALTYVYIISSDSRWRERAKKLLQDHGKFEVVDSPQEAELFLQLNHSDGRVKYEGNRVAGALGGTSTTYANYKAAELYARWYKKDPMAPENVQERQIYYRFQKGSNAVEAALQHFLASVDGPKPKVKAARPK
jgi:hypothetical protein